jgi:glutathione S-transferase
MVLKLYGVNLSTCTRRVATVLYEKNIPFELITVDIMKGEHKSAEYLKKQPFGQVPYIVRPPLPSWFYPAVPDVCVYEQDDSGVIIFESRAICRYIEGKYPSKGPRLAVPPGGTLEYALYEQACSIEFSNFDPFASTAVAELVFNP